MNHPFIYPVVVRVFLGWSGEDSRSHRLALILRAWLKNVLPFVEPWVSSEDIDKGDVWLRALRDGLHGARFGIVCLFPESLTRPSWVVFEAGVIWHAVEKSRLAPLLVDVERGSLPGPLQIFQVTLDDKDEIRKLVRSINKEADEEQAIPREKFDARFEAYWPSLEADLNALRSSPAEESQPEEATPGTRPPVLAAEQIAILQLIDDNIMNTDLGLAAHLGLKLGKTNYFIDGLEELGYLSYGGFRPGQRLRYYVTSKGRKYLHGQNSFPAQAVAQPSELHTPQPVITGQPTEIQSAHTPIERIEAAQKLCLVPRQFPVYNP